MTCARYADADIAERYVLGQMEEAEQASFEEHFFGCDDCFASVQVLQQMQAALREGPQPAPAVSSGNTSSQPLKFDASRARGTRQRVIHGIGVTWWGLAVAATLLLPIVWWQRCAPVEEVAPTVARQAEPTGPPIAPPATPGQGQTQTPTPTQAPPPAPRSEAATPGQPPQPTTSPRTTPREQTPAPMRPARDFGVLALVVPPPYVALQTRGAGDAQAQAFAAAMTRYSAKDYQGAAEDLQTIAEAQPDAAHVQFFLGISLLMTDKPAGARRALERAAASGTAPFADEAHFYLAKAALRERDLERAERELQIAVERDAGPAGEAARLLREVRRKG